MPLSLHTIQGAPGSKKKRVRIGRGGKRGTYSGKGMKGQRARSGGRRGLKRLGAKPLVEQTPKLRGFKSLRKKPAILNLKDLTADLNADLRRGSERGADSDFVKITPQILLKRGLVDKIKNGVKILGNGEIDFKIEVSGCKVSKSAREKIEKAGGKIII